MGSFTTEKRRPDEWNRDKQLEDPSGGPIGNTKGIWVRRMDNGDIEMFHDGKFVASWGVFNEHVAVTMMEHAFEHGRRLGAKENQTKMREALGLKP